MNELIAQDGMWLTQKECQDSDRVFVSRIKGVNATWEYWEQWTDAQAEQWHKDHPDPQPEPENID